jgi:hypothetical protein
MTTTTSPTAEAIRQALTELNDQVPADCEDQTRDEALAEMTALHTQLGLDIEAVMDAANQQGRTAMTVYTPQDFLQQPVESMAGLWQAGFLVGARVQQLLSEPTAADD